MEPLDFYASERQYLDHLLPVYSALPEHARGEFWLGTRRGADRYARELGFHGRACAAPPRRPTPTVVASYGDEKTCHGRPIALLEHGAGQQYSDGNPGYSGGRDRAEVGLFLCPSETVAARNRLAYPDAVSVAVGCPKLDRWHRRMPCFCAGPGGATGSPDPADPDGLVCVAGPWEVADACDWHGANSPLESGGPRRPVVAISFHWPTPGPPEAGNAFDHFAPALRDLATSFPTVIGHAHPRFYGAVVPRYDMAGIQPVRNFSTVLDLADVYICDNSSTIYEFASTDRPVVLMNSPTYRRDVEHGLRFWNLATVGLQVNRPSRLVEAVELALADPDVIADERDRCVREVYSATDGLASARAAAALLEWRPDRSRIRRISKG